VAWIRRSERELVRVSDFGQTTVVPPAENKARVRRFYEEAWANGVLDVIDEVFADDYVRHDLRPTQALPAPKE
jgi:hypothetical protein